jgi:DNA polymerase-1
MGSYVDIAKEALRQFQEGVSAETTEIDDSKALPPFLTLYSDPVPSESNEPFRIPSLLISSRDALGAWVERYRNSVASMITIDIETTGLNFAKDRIAGIALNICNENVYVAFGHNNEHELDLDTATALLNPLFSSSRPKLCHHATFDVPFLLRQGFDVAPPFYDTRLIAREIHARAVKSYKLKDLACEHIHPNCNFWNNQLESKLKSRFGSTKKDNLWRLPSSDVFGYACADVYLTRRLFDIFRGKVQQSAFCMSYLTLERQVTKVIASIIRNGFRVDEQKLHESLEARRKDIIVVDAKLDELFGPSKPSYTSPKQVLTFLQELGFNPINPDTGKSSVCADALRGLKTDAPEISTLLHRRKIENQLKQLSGIPAHISQDRIHPHMTISAQLGERFNCTSPSLYTGKKHADFDELTLRHFITPDTGYSLVFFDFSASHFRILAHLSGDETMISIFRNGQDFHRAAASMIFDTPYDSVTKEQRDNAKPIGFSVIYGMGSRSLAESLNIEIKEAVKLKSQFLNKVFPKVGEYLHSIHHAVESRGYVLSGIHGIRVTVPKDQAYKGINYQIQVTEAEMLKRSLVDLHQFLALHKSKIGLPVHDEIIVQVHDDESHLIPKIKEIIEHHELRVPIVCDVAIAKSCWAEKDPIEVSAT